MDYSVMNLQCHLCTRSLPILYKQKSWESELYHLVESAELTCCLDHTFQSLIAFTILNTHALNYWSASGFDFILQSVRTTSCSLISSVYLTWNELVQL